MAEFVMKDLLDKAGIADVVVESAAMHTDAIGCNVHSGTRAKLQEKGIPFTRRAAWLLTAEKAHAYDLLIGMDDYNVRDLRRLVDPSDREKIRKLSAIAGQAEDLADPWYTGDFEATWKGVLAGCRALVEQIVAERTRIGGRDER